MAARFYITTPIYYINAEPHLGHAYTTIVADAIARARRLRGDDVFFLTGTDEHGQKVERAARAAAQDPMAFADRTSQKFRELFSRLNISNDDFIRTTEPRHIKAAQEIWRRVRDRGFLYKAAYEGWYCTVDELFVPETQLVDGKCPTCGNPVERLAEESYFFKLSAFQDRLLDLYERHPEFITPDIRRNEIAAFVAAGLRDLSVSRTSFRWGIPVPDDPKHVMYVWFDALTNYLTAAGFPDDAARQQRYWPADIHLMGKEIVRQHAVYWPAFLMAADLPLPKRIIGHGWWLMNEAKMSKSLGNVVRPDDYVRIFGVDAFRYYVLREMTLGQDASFSDDTFLTRYNADLANDLGNVVSRVATMIERYCGGRVPGPAEAAETAVDHELRKATEAAVKAAFEAADRLDFSQALREVWDLIARVNKYVVVREPWTLAKSESSRPLLETTLCHAAGTLSVVAALVHPVMPQTARRMSALLGSPLLPWDDRLPHARLEPGRPLGTIDHLFPRIDLSVEELRAQWSTPVSDQNPGTPAPAPAAPSAAAAPAAAPASADNRISIDDFLKVDLRVARVLAAEKVPNSRKLMKLSIDVGTEQRTLVAGIAEAYEAEQLVGKTIGIVFNLKPAKLMGIESNGMILAASPEGGKPVLVAFDGDIAPGSRIK
ncbi:MAG TPA: methionine--tRNA ligase [Vicinamibacterales bacterium]|nr:methionine--tRNA ligase [Vicinamibacterales bacterium]